MRVCMLTDEYIPGGADYGRAPVFCDFQLRQSWLDNRSTEWRKRRHRTRRFARCGEWMFQFCRNATSHFCIAWNASSSFYE